MWWSKKKKDKEPEKVEVKADPVKPAEQPRTEPPKPVPVPTETKPTQFSYVDAIKSQGNTIKVAAAEPPAYKPAPVSVKPVKTVKVVERSSEKYDLNEIINKSEKSQEPKPPKPEPKPEPVVTKPEPPKKEEFHEPVSKPTPRKSAPRLRAGGVRRTQSKPLASEPVPRVTPDKIAVFIDLDNTGATYANLLEIFSILKPMGKIKFGKLYGVTEAHEDELSEIITANRLATVGKTKFKQPGTHGIDTRLVTDCITITGENKYDTVFIWTGIGELTSLFSVLRDLGCKTLTIDEPNTDCKNRFVNQALELYSINKRDMIPPVTQAAPVAPPPPPMPTEPPPPPPKPKPQPKPEPPPPVLPRKQGAPEFNAKKKSEEDEDEEENETKDPFAEMTDEDEIRMLERIRRNVTENLRAEREEREQLLNQFGDLGNLDDIAPSFDDATPAHTEPEPHDNTYNTFNDTGSVPKISGDLGDFGNISSMEQTYAKMSEEEPQPQQNEQDKQWQEDHMDDTERALMEIGSQDFLGGSDPSGSVDTSPDDTNESSFSEDATKYDAEEEAEKPEELGYSDFVSDFNKPSTFESSGIRTGGDDTNN